MGVSMNFIDRIALYVGVMYISMFWGGIPSTSKSCFAAVALGSAFAICSTILDRKER